MLNKHFQGPEVLTQSKATWLGQGGGLGFLEFLTWSYAYDGPYDHEFILSFIRSQQKWGHRWWLCRAAGIRPLASHWNTRGKFRLYPTSLERNAGKVMELGACLRWPSLHLWTDGTFFRTEDMLCEGTLGQRGILSLTPPHLPSTAGPPLRWRESPTERLY